MYIMSIISQSSITTHPIGYSNRIFPIFILPLGGKVILQTFLWPFHHPSQESNL